MAKDHSNEPCHSSKSLTEILGTAERTSSTETYGYADQHGSIPSTSVSVSNAH